MRVAFLATLMIVLVVMRASADSTNELHPGEAVYLATCAACHGVSGEGNGPVAFALKPPPRNFRKDPFKQGDSAMQIFVTITTGLAGTKMVGYPQLGDDDRWNLATYVHAFRP